MMNITVQGVVDFVSPIALELGFFVFFLIGYMLKAPSKKRVSVETHPEAIKLQKHIAAEIAAGNNVGVLELWRSKSPKFVTSVEILKSVAQALATHDADACGELIDHIAAHPRHLANTCTAVAILEVFAKAGDIKNMEKLVDMFQGIHVAKTHHVLEVIVGGYAAAGREQEMSNVWKQFTAINQKPTRHAYALAIRGLTKSGKIDAALEAMGSMCKDGFCVPAAAVENLLRAACASSRVGEILLQVKEYVTVSTEVGLVVLEHCQKRGDTHLAHTVEDLLRVAGTTLPSSVFDLLLKTYVVGSDPYATKLFAEMRCSGVNITEGLCVGLLARCADSKFLTFAEEIADYVRTSKLCSLSFYGSLMKVYAHSGLPGKATDLYDELIANGLEPDSMMCGCLMKFAADCGRTDLSRRLSANVPCLVLQNYVSLIRAAGQDKDVEQAFKVLERLRKSGLTIDVAAYNCVVDVCSSCGDMHRARALVSEMKEEVQVDIITMNTLLKGYVQKKDLAAAKRLFQDIKEMGLEPNDVSYNLYLNATLHVGDFTDAWQTVDAMEKHGYLDHYSVSIMMKGLKKNYNKNHNYLTRAFRLLEKSGISVCSDDVLLTTTMEACMWYRDTDRINEILLAFYGSKLKPSVSTYGMLIKAASISKRVDQCWYLWRLAVEERSLVPTQITLGCMLDALVTNHLVDDASKLFDDWKDVVKPNAVLYSTLAKGFSRARQPARAMALWKEMCTSGIQINTVACNSIIDAQVRCGKMDNVSKIMAVMECQNCKPDAITFSILIRGYCFKGNLNEGLEVLRRAQKSGLIKDAGIYHALLDGCVREVNLQIAEQLLDDMKRHNIAPTNLTLVRLVQLYSRGRDLEKAFSVSKSLSQQHGFEVDIQVKQCLISACISNCDINRALQVFAELRAEGDSPVSETYCALIYGCTRFRRLTEAVALVEDAYGLAVGSRPGLPRGDSLDRQCLEHLMRGLKAEGSMETIGVPLLERLRIAKEPAAAQVLLKSLKHA